MTPTTNTFGAFALTILTVFALWSSTLAVPASAAATSTASAPAAVAAPAFA